MLGNQVTFQGWHQDLLGLCSPNNFQTSCVPRALQRMEPPDAAAWKPHLELTQLTQRDFFSSKTAVGHESRSGLPLSLSRQLADDSGSGSSLLSLPPLAGQLGLWDGVIAVPWGAMKGSRCSSLFYSEALLSAKSIKKWDTTRQIRICFFCLEVHCHGSWG